MTYISCDVIECKFQSSCYSQVCDKEEIDLQMYDFKDGELLLVCANFEPKKEA